VDQGAARLALEKAQERKALELFHQNRLVESEREYRQLIAAGARNPEVCLNLSAIFWLTGRTEAAVEPLHTAIALDPANPEAHATLGTALQGIG
jgi:Flp pilus assembly protein TadD